MKKLFIVAFVLSSFAVSSVAFAGGACCATKNKQKEEAVQTTESAAAIQEGTTLEAVPASVKTN